MNYPKRTEKVKPKTISLKLNQINKVHHIVINGSILRTPRCTKLSSVRCFPLHRSSSLHNKLSSGSYITINIREQLSYSTHSHELNAQISARSSFNPILSEAIQCTKYCKHDSTHHGQWKASLGNWNASKILFSLKRNVVNWKIFRIIYYRSCCRYMKREGRYSTPTTPPCKKFKIFDKFLFYLAKVVDLFTTVGIQFHPEIHAKLETTYNNNMQSPNILKKQFLPVKEYTKRRETERFYLNTTSMVSFS